MRKKRSFLAVMGLLVGTMSFAGGTAAYLSKSAGEVKNVFTAGSVKAQLTEAHWDTQKASKVYPGQILEKDPVVKNIGENSANVFLEVNVPMRSIAVLDGSTGRKTIRENRELFTFQADETKWILLYQEKTSGNKKYIYGYKSVLNPGESTTLIFFQRVKFTVYLTNFNTRIYTSEFLSRLFYTFLSISPVITIPSGIVIPGSFFGSSRV